MVDFNNLPNELILQIIELLLPEDLESFVSTCRLAYNLAWKSLREHRKLKREYRSWFTNPFESYNCLYVLLREILRNPRIALYVEELDVQDLFSDWPSESEAGSASNSDVEPGTGLTKDSQSRDDERAMFRKAINECTYVSADDVEEWCDVLESGMDDAVLALLVTLLPKLKRLVVQFDPEIALLFLETIRGISTTSSTLSSSIPLSHLTEVTLEHYDGSIDIGDLWPFFAFPSMRFVSGISVCHNDMIPLPERSSDVIQVNWVQPWELTTEKTKNFFGIFKALQTFRFLPECSTEWDVQTIRDSLILYAKHTLKTLSLYIDDLDDWYQVCIEGLRAFEVLKKIEINAILLLGDRGPFRKTLADVLPKSIEDVTIQDYGLSRREYRSLVLDLLSVKHHCLPNVKRLSFRESFFNPHVGITEDDELKLACKDAGFILVISRDVQSGYGCFRIRVEGSSGV